MNKNIDFIGDVHGHASELEALLGKMGYSRISGTWRHPDRSACFVGDIIDRGDENIKAMNIVRNMLDAGSATMVMGNHELNAIAFYHGLRARNEKNKKQHGAFLDEVKCDSQEHRAAVEWMMTLPLFFDNENFRVVHACWQDDAAQIINEAIGEYHTLHDHALIDMCSDNGNPLFRATEILLKGPEFPLPESVTVKDKHGYVRTQARLRWWKNGDGSWDDYAMLNGLECSGDFPPGEFPKTLLPPKPRERKPTFFGHYWMEGTPAIQGETMACVDFSVANGGHLVAYRWNGEQTLSDSNFVKLKSA